MALNEKIKKSVKKYINQKRGYAYRIDSIQLKNSSFELDFWLYTYGKTKPKVTVEFRTSKSLEKIQLKKPFVRQDVFEESDKFENAYRCGYKFATVVTTAEDMHVLLKFNTDYGLKEIEIGSYKPNKEYGELEVIEQDEGIDYTEFLRKKDLYLSQVNSKKDIQKKVDIIIPVYNGYKYLDKLFVSIQKTSLEYRVIVVNDASPDQRVREYLNKIKNQFKEMVLIENDSNLGFVVSVNKALSIAENDVALVNTDVEVPSFWLERLMKPVFNDTRVASSTPFTNSGTICSFPEYLKDNKLFEGMDVCSVDEAFNNLIPRYNSIPTGVGFCMGMSYKALCDVGKFDADTFGKGYGEENDWCRRAIQNGYKNVYVENLFVYHNHGGSFQSEDKRRYLAENEKKLLLKHPEYNKEVALFVKRDPAKYYRDLALIDLLKTVNPGNTIVAFNHSLGGGATAYLDNYKKEQIYKESKVITIRYDYGEFFWVNIEYKSHRVEFRVNDIEDVFELLDCFDTDQIIINELISYQKIEGVIESIVAYKKQKNAKMTMLLHDYYCICPSTNLLNYNGTYCGIPDVKQCNQCTEHLRKTRYKDYTDIKEWRNIWSVLLNNSDEIIAFSNSSKELLKKAYPHIDKVIVKPHQVNNLLPLHKNKKTTTTINIGLLGILTKHKGSDIVREMLSYIKRNSINVRIILIGESEEKIENELFVETGLYTREELPALIYKYDIDIFLITSIWPETFSYTTEEIMKLNMPLAAFDLGAPAERVKKYEKGIVLSEMSAGRAVDSVINFWKKYNIIVPEKDKERILFLTEYESFSSRYRVSHFMEQLSFNYIASDFVKVKNVKNVKLKKYSVIVLYRCVLSRELEALIRQAKKANILVLYDIDDYIFEYKNIKHLNFLEQPGYRKYEDYSDGIKKCMSKCDGYITSTETLKKGIADCFPDRPVIVNRNVASMQMLTLSIKAQQQVVKKKEKVVIGYFSGSTTHNKDFELIDNVLTWVLEQYEHVELILAGHIQESNRFAQFQDRITNVEFMDWKDCPQLQASVDIHLMPLETSFFHQCKSENKWTEAALVKGVTIASYNDELARVIKDEKTGYLCKNETEWKVALDKLIVDSELRKEISQNAYEEVIKNHTTLNTGKAAIDEINKIRNDRRNKVCS